MTRFGFGNNEFRKLAGLIRDVVLDGKKVRDEVTILRRDYARGLCSDADDEKFLSAALGGHADFIVTKNKKHFPKDAVLVKIVNVREFLGAIEKLRG